MAGLLLYSKEGIDANYAQVVSFEFHGVASGIQVAIAFNSDNYTDGFYLMDHTVEYTFLDEKTGLTSFQVPLNQFKQVLPVDFSSIHRIRITLTGSVSTNATVAFDNLRLVGYTYTP
jgi:hypothetical protein